MALTIKFPAFMRQPLVSFLEEYKTRTQDEADRKVRDIDDALYSIDLAPPGSEVEISLSLFGVDNIPFGLITPDMIVSSPPITPTIPEGYVQTWTWERKILFVLAKEKMWMSSKEIVNELAAFDIKTKANKKVALRSISGTLSLKSRGDDKVFASQSNERGDFVYGLLKWERDGKIS